MIFEFEAVTRMKIEGFFEKDTLASKGLGWQSSSTLEESYSPS